MIPSIKTGNTSKILKFRYRMSRVTEDSQGELSIGYRERRKSKIKGEIYVRAGMYRPKN